MKTIQNRYFLMIYEYDCDKCLNSRIIHGERYCWPMLCGMSPLDHVFVENKKTKYNEEHVFCTEYKFEDE